MKNIPFLIAALSVSLFFGGAYGKSPENTSTAQIKQAIIKESVSSYPGNCPCPYNSARNGSSCGKRSAYSRAGGYSVICYPNDVTDEMVRNYRKR